MIEYRDLVRIELFISLDTKTMPSYVTIQYLYAHHLV